MPTTPGCRELGARLSGDAALVRPGRPIRCAASVRGEVVTVEGEPVLPAAEVPLPGRHMLSNVLAAALGAAPGRRVTRPRSPTGMRGFAGVPHRLETRGRARRRALGERLAGHHPAGSHRPGWRRSRRHRWCSSPAVAARAWTTASSPRRSRARARAVILIGESAEALDGLIAGRVPTQRAASMDEAVRRAADLAEPGDVVLLSPAAASFDMFADYAARGDAFRAAVAALDGGAA